MQTDLIIIDNFYRNPVEVRSFALGSEFSVRGNFPGQRTKPCLNDATANAIQRIIRCAGGEVTSHSGQYSGCFQYNTKHQRSWIHCDQYSSWAGVCYLTPDAPFSAGTGFFMHKETGLYREPSDPDLAKKLCSEGSQFEKWELADVVSNKFNRLVIYRGGLYHSSLDYFGECKHTGRLFQTFFFNSEK